MRPLLPLGPTSEAQPRQAVCRCSADCDGHPDRSSAPACSSPQPPLLPSRAMQAAGHLHSTLRCAPDYLLHMLLLCCAEMSSGLQEPARHQMLLLCTDRDRSRGGRGIWRPLHTLLLSRGCSGAAREWHHWSSYRMHALSLTKRGATARAQGRGRKRASVTGGGRRQKRGARRYSCMCASIGRSLVSPITIGAPPGHRRPRPTAMQCAASTKASAAPSAAARAPRRQAGAMAAAARPQGEAPGRRALGWPLFAARALTLPSLLSRGPNAAPLPTQQVLLRPSLARPRPGRCRRAAGAGPRARW